MGGGGRNVVPLKIWHLNLVKQYRCISEGWVSGLNQRFAKPPTSAMGSASSNLAPSADWVLGVMVAFKSPKFAVIVRVD